MNPTPERKTLADYVAIAISPVLIMALVGSLVFFLVEISYARGEHVSRLRWMLFFFVFGAVLVARISMTGEIADRAGLYGFFLGGLVWLALLMYVNWENTGPLAPFGWLIDLGLIVIVWWCAHRLTWDCTLIDDSVDASGAGLLQVAGLEQASEPSASPGAASPAAGQPADNEPGLIGWWERYRRYREEKRRRPHTPGVWVVYFSLAALPLFGLGQSRIPPEDEARRQYVFWLMIIYVASGLGLLVTTSFLGLRRYLRQRRLQMPLAMTGAWLMLGGLLIAAFLAAGAILPRPNAEYRVLDDWLGQGGLETGKQKASRHAQVGDDPGKDQGHGAQDKPGEKQDGGKDKDGKSEKRGQSRGKDGKPSDKAEKDATSRDARGEHDKSKDGQRKPDKGEPQNEKDNKGGRQRERQADDRREEGKGEKEPEDKQDENGQSPSSSPLQNIRQHVSDLLKWILGIAAAILVLFLLLRFGMRFLANFTHWARRLLAAFQAFWQALLNWFSGKGGRPEEESIEVEAVSPPRPFASFRDPFQHGTAERMSPEQLVRYSFAALEAWAWERDLGRQTGETPLEFVARLGDEFPALEGEARRLANFYVQIAYARSQLARSCREPLRRFWQLLMEVEERPLSAGVGAAEEGP
jgi:hypothetical protein